MSNPISENVSTTETNDETHSLNRPELLDVIKADSSQS